MRIHGPFDFTSATEREWLLTNGLGGYASATLCGMLTRRYHGLLVAALNPPGNRTLLVAKLEERLEVGGETLLLSTNQYPDVVYPRGYLHLTEFDLQDERMVMRFAAGGARLEKQVAMVQGENTTRVRYRNTGEAAFTLRLTPLVNGRNFHGETAAGSIDFAVESGRWANGPQVSVRPQWMTEPYYLYADAGAWRDERDWYYNVRYAWEERRGLTDVDNHFSPGSFSIDLTPGEEVIVSLSTGAPPASPPRDAGAVLPSPRTEMWILDNAPPEIARLYRTAHSFLVRRGQQGRTIIAGYHWFGDWGRDTMIALPGLCLLTGRHNDAAEILRTFATARRRGLIPNLFLESGAGEAYNAADASLWYVYAVERYFNATGDRVLVEELRPALEEIIHYYRTGTDFGIGMDSDGLIIADAPRLAAHLDGCEGWRLGSDAAQWEAGGNQRPLVQRPARNGDVCAGIRLAGRLWRPRRPRPRGFCRLLVP